MCRGILQTSTNCIPRKIERGEVGKRERRRLSKRKHESRPFNWIETRFSLNLFAGWLIGWDVAVLFRHNISYALLRLLRFYVRAAIVHTYTWIRMYIGMEIDFDYDFVYIEKPVARTSTKLIYAQHRHKEDCNATFCWLFTCHLNEAVWAIWQESVSHLGVRYICAWNRGLVLFTLSRTCKSQSILWKVVNIQMELLQSHKSFCNLVQQTKWLTELKLRIRLDVMVQVWHWLVGNKRGENRTRKRFLRSGRPVRWLKIKKMCSSVNKH